MVTLVTVGLLAVGGTATAPTASACIGGTAFDWAVAHTHGGILRATVAHVNEREDFSEDLSLVDPRVIRGDPPFGTPVHAVAGYLCDQSADPGDVVLILFDVRGQYGPDDRPLYYVIGGRGALSEREVDAGLGRLPATDAAVGRIESVPPAGSGGVAWLAAAWILGLVLAARRFGRREGR